MLQHRLDPTTLFAAYKGGTNGSRPDRRKIRFDGTRFRRDIAAQRCGKEVLPPAMRDEHCMKLFQRIILMTSLAGLLAQPVPGRGQDATKAMPEFKDVYEAVRAHLTGESAADLNRDAVQGLLQQLHGKVSLVEGKSAPAESSSAGPVLAKSAVYDGPVAYLRVGKVAAGLAGQITAAYKDLSASNRLKGIVLDLRFARGKDYSEAVAVADLFISKERPLLDWGNGVVQSKANPDALTLPLAVLVNQETAAATEALAAALREDDRAIIIGATTAGEAAMTQEFPLPNGQLLRIATAAIKLGDGEMLSPKGIKPDIQVAVKPDDEKAYFADPFKELSSSLNVIASIVGEPATNAMNSSNRTARAHQINEAELMRLRKEKPGLDLDAIPLPDSTEADNDIEKPVIRDPVLGRALDLVKGIAALSKTTIP